MNQAFKKFVAGALEKIGYSVVNRGHLQQLIAISADFEELLALPRPHLNRLLDLAPKSKSQMRQDLFVLSELGFKERGYFVDFGATNGVDLNNSYLLEKEFGWTGIVAEPAKCWHEELIRNRTCNIETNCVWKESNKVLSFNEVNEPELSTINAYSAADTHSPRRTKGKIFDVSTISLTDLLGKYAAPRIIDFLSIDTEGSEYEILSSFDFDRYQFRVITCEHNFTDNREKIINLLTSKGYVQKFVGFSKVDSWFVCAGG